MATARITVHLVLDAPVDAATRDALAATAAHWLDALGADGLWAYGTSAATAPDNYRLAGVPRAAYHIED